MPVPFRLPFWLTLIALSWSVGVAPLHAQSALPFSAATSLGPRGAPAQASITSEGEETVLRLSVGRDAAEARVRGRTTEGSAESVVTSAGRVVVLRGSGPARVAAVFVSVGGHIRLAWSGRLDLRGDLGERWADVLELTDRTGDGVIDLMVGVAREGIARCDSDTPAVLSPRVLTARGELRSVELRRGLPRPGPNVLAAEPLDAAGSGTTTEPLVRALRFVGATSSSTGEDPASLGPPSALADGDPATVWAEGRPGDGSGELLVGRWSSELPIQSIRLRAGPGVALPREVSLVLSAESAVAYRLPSGASEAWLTFPVPVRASCVSLVIDQGAAGTLPTGFGEISVYTEFDGSAGIASLVEELVAESERAGEIADWLGRLGDPACVALDGAWDRLSMLGRLWAMRVAGSVRTEAGVALLYRGSGDGSAEVREEALRRLVQAGAFAALAERAASADPIGDEAALALAAAESARLERPAVLFDALDEGRGRPALRLASARVGGENEAAVRAFTGTGRALAALALGLVDERLGSRGREGRQALASEVAARALPSVTDFEDRYRLALAAAHFPHQPDVDAWLAQQATSAEEWMQRAAALSALGSATPTPVLEHALSDPYPRVRLAAVAILSASPDEARLRAALTDGWPTVRLAALVALHEPTSALAALGDDVALVRAGAIEVLTELGDRSAYPSIEERLTDRDEWPEVVRAGLRYVQTLCLADAGAALAQVVRRGARDGAWAPDVELAIDALGVAFRLGGDAAARSREAAASGGASIAAFEPVLAREESFEHCAP